ncbi:HAD-IA family hydrolase [Candidatus Woesearchaeota archaeon]|nr:HAD-IA family hydrolase [Candidatus Woesearchaeota archaeon]
MISKLPFDAVLFDFDGVILDSYAATKECYKVVWNHFGVPWDEQRFIDNYSVNWKRNYEFLGFDINKAQPIWDEHMDKIRHIIKPFEGIFDAIEILKEFNSELKLGIASSNYRENIIKSISSHLNLFDIILGCEDVQNIKPAPDCILLGAKKLNVSLDRMVYVGDTAIDVQAARRAKVAYAVAVAWGNYESLNKIIHSKPDCLLCNTSEIADLDFWVKEVKR